MARVINRFTATQALKFTAPGYHHDGRGLYLQVTKSGAKSWLFRYERAGKKHWHGLGPFPDVSLSQARDRADGCRQLLRSNIDPIDHRRKQEAQARAESARGISFKDCARAFIESHRPGWRNEKHAAQWENTLSTYAFPVFGDRPVQDIDVELVLRALQPIWSSKTETATRVRQRIENVLDWAAARGYRHGENPARWRGHLDKLLPKRSRVQKVKHHAALPYGQLPSFYGALRSRDTLSSKALAFVVLTAARSGEVRNATWDEVTLREGVWTVPAERMKAGRPHRVPLVPEAIEILREVEPLQRDDNLIFPGHRQLKPLSDAAMRKLLQEDMRYKDLTVHGFRSTFRDWCAEATGFPRELAEAALAHMIRDRTEAAYQRGDMFERRRELMEAWTRYATSPEWKTVISLANRKGKSTDLAGHPAK